MFEALGNLVAVATNDADDTYSCDADGQARDRLLFVLSVSGQHSASLQHYYLPGCLSACLPFCLLSICFCCACELLFLLKLVLDFVGPTVQNSD